MTKIWNQINNKGRVYNHRIIDQPSQTIPDQAMSVRELLERHTSSQPLEGNLNPIYQEEDTPSDGINPLTLDLVDVQRMKMENEEKINSNIEKLRNKRIEENNIIQARLRQAEIDKAIAENEANKRKLETDKTH